VTRTGTAPTAVASAVWSTKKFDRGEVASAVTTTSGVRLLAASVIPVSALVRPHPWCRLSAATPPLVRA
jgi:predicted Na+-dependent transporter